MHPIPALLASLLLLAAPALAHERVRVWVPPPLPPSFPPAPPAAPQVSVNVHVRLIRIVPERRPRLYADEERWPGYIGPSLRRKPY